MTSKTPKDDGILNFDDYSSLSDAEMVKMVTRQLEALREEAKTNPGVTPEMIEKTEAALKHFTSAVELEKLSHQAAAVAKQNLDLAAARLLAHPALSHGKPFPIAQAKRKGN